jgi:hypothetical protein
MVEEGEDGRGRKGDYDDEVKSVDHVSHSVFVESSPRSSASCAASSVAATGVTDGAGAFFSDGGRASLSAGPSQEKAKSLSAALKELTFGRSFNFS